MFILKKILLLVSLLFLPFRGEALLSKPEITFMHAFKTGDFLEKKLAELIQHYNENPNAIGTVTLVPGGDYTESFQNITSGKLHPHIAMISEYNSVAMSEHPDLYVPLSDMLNVDEISFFPVIRKFYSFNGKMASYPFNCSVPALYYNKEAFQKAGLPDRAPQTWEEITDFSTKLQKAGLGGFTFAWPAGYALEHFAVVNNVPFASHHNGFENPEKAQLLLTTPPFLQQLTFLQDQIKKGTFVYAGDRAEDAEQLFLDGKVSILMQGANRHALLLSKKPSFSMGVGPYPYKASLTQKPYAINVGGTSLWVMKGHSQKDQKAIAHFLQYLSSPEIQAKWHQDTAYLPVTKEAYDLTLKSGFYESHPAARIAVEQITRLPQNLPNGIRLPDYGATRQKITAMLGRIFQERKPIESEVISLTRSINQKVKEPSISKEYNSKSRK